MIKIPQNEVVCQNVVAGEFVAARGEVKSVISPYTGKVVGSVRMSTNEDVHQAVVSAKKAQAEWAQVSLKDRCKILFQLRDLLLRDIEELANLVSLESGKTIAEAKAGVLKGIEVLEFALSSQNLDTMAKMEVSREVFCEYRREPLGVVAGITPFNFPIMVPMWMIPIAIVVGNSFVWKPSDKTPLAPQKMAMLALEAGLPKGVLTVVNGGRETVEAILDHKEIHAVGFVGSTAIAKAVYTRGTANGKRVLALGGAKNHIALLPDAEIEMSARGITDSFTGCAGQRCMAASTLLAVGDVEKIIAEMVKKSSQIVLGKDMGAIISKESLEKLHTAIARAEKEGARVVLDGRKAKAPVDIASEYAGGFWLGPTILDNVKPGTEAACSELFGPVISIVRCQNISEALKIENENPYGNAASIFTSSGAHAERWVREARAGMVGVNIGVPVPREPFSFGGFYESRFGSGDITGEDGLQFWSQVKKVTTKWAMQKDNNWMS